MEMRTHLRKCRYPLCEFSGNNTRLQRTQTNTQDSFHLMYGTEYGLTLQNLPAGGSRVTIRLPKITTP